jgi:hypothetical protein
MFIADDQQQRRTSFFFVFTLLAFFQPRPACSSNPSLVRRSMMNNYMMSGDMTGVTSSTMICWALQDDESLELKMLLKTC